MHVQSPLFLLLLLAAVAAWRWRASAAAGGALAIAIALLTCAAAGVSVDFPRRLHVVAMVDVSPSTRTAHFRDERFVQSRLAQMLPGAQVEVRYFADGSASGPGEVAAARTRLPAIGADAVVLFSDGRFPAPAAPLPLIFASVDDVLDQPGDARIDDLRLAAATQRAAAERAIFDIGGSPVGRTLTTIGTDLPSATLQEDPISLIATATATRVAARLSPGDAWPENDEMAIDVPPRAAAEPWAIGVDIPGARAVVPAKLPADLAGYIGASAIVVRDAAALPAVSQHLLRQYVDVLGGALILLDPPAELPAELRRIAPLSPAPPTPKARWTILLDASGSMATGDRWPRALAAAAAAAGALEPQERVNVALFADQLRVMARGLSPADAAARLTAMRAVIAPSGPTGLRGALAALAEESARRGDEASAAPTPMRLLIISDGDASVAPAAPLAAALRAATITPFLLSTAAAADAGVNELVAAAGGATIPEADPAQWAAAAARLVAAARGGFAAGDVDAIGAGPLAGLRYTAPGIWQTFPLADSEIMATAGTQPAAARQHVGLGTVTAFAATPPAEAMATIIQRLQRSPIDPRFSVRVDRASVRVIAVDGDQPMNDRQIVGRLANAAEINFSQIAPGTYSAAAPPGGGVLSIALGDVFVTAIALPDRYAEEFDAIGNDRAALADLAQATGGRLIEPGDRASLQLPRATRRINIDPWLLAGGFVATGAALLFLRAPYLAAILRRRVGRTLALCWHAFGRSSRE